MNEAKTEQEYESQPLKNFAMPYVRPSERQLHCLLNSDISMTRSSNVAIHSSCSVFASIFSLAYRNRAQLPTQLSAADFRPFYAKSCTLPHFMLLLSSIVYAII